MDRPSIVKNRMIKRDPIYYTVDDHTKDPVAHVKRAQKKARRSIVRIVDDNVLFKRNEK